MLILIIKTIHLVTLVCFIKWQLLRFLIKVKLNWLILATAHLNKSESFFFKCNRFFQSSSVCFQLGIWKDASQTKGERLSTADFGNEKAKDRVTRCWVWSIFFWKCTTGKTNGSKRLLSVSGCISKWNGRQNVVASNSWWHSGGIHLVSEKPSRFVEQPKVRSCSPGEDRIGRRESETLWKSQF